MSAYAGARLAAKFAVLWAVAAPVAAWAGPESGGLLLLLAAAASVALTGQETCNLLHEDTLLARDVDNFGGAAPIEASTESERVAPTPVRGGWRPWPGAAAEVPTIKGSSRTARINIRENRGKPKAAGATKSVRLHACGGVSDAELAQDAPIVMQPMPKRRDREMPRFRDGRDARKQHHTAHVREQNRDKPKATASEVSAHGTLTRRSVGESLQGRSAKLASGVSRGETFSWLTLGSISAQHPSARLSPIDEVDLGLDPCSRLADPS